MISPLERARLLDAEMRLQRAWLDLSLREMSNGARGSPLAFLQPLKLGMIGMSVLKHRSLWLAGLSLALNLFRRRANKEK